MKNAKNIKNDLKTSESPSFEELDTNDEVEIIPDENDTNEPLIVLKEEVVRQEAKNEFGACVCQARR